MASTMIHYIIAKKIAETVPIQDSSRFMLGAAILPDASSHDDGSYDKAHFQAVSANGLNKGIDYSLFERKYSDLLKHDSVALGYWCHLIQDAIWFHDVVDSHIRIYPRNDRRKYLEKGYRDYVRLNYLLQKEYNLKIPSFDMNHILIDEVQCEKIPELINKFVKSFNTVKCTNEDLELYSWDMLQQYIDKCVLMCVHELNALSGREVRTDPVRYFVGV